MNLLGLVERLVITWLLLISLVIVGAAVGAIMYLILTVISLLSS